MAPRARVPACARGRSSQRLSAREASHGRDLCPEGNNRTAEEMTAEVDAEAGPGWSRAGLPRGRVSPDPSWRRRSPGSPALRRSGSSGTAGSPRRRRRDRASAPSRPGVAASRRHRQDQARLHGAEGKHAECEDPPIFSAGRMPDAARGDSPLGPGRRASGVAMMDCPFRQQAVAAARGHGGRAFPANRVLTGLGRAGWLPFFSASIGPGSMSQHRQY